MRRGSRRVFFRRKEWNPARTCYNPPVMKAPRLLSEKLRRAICCAAAAVVLLFAPSATAQTEGESTPVRAEERVGDSRLATLGDLRHLENEMRAELREIHATIRWLLIALIAVLGLPQLSAWWDRRRGGGNGNGKGISAAVSFALAAAPWALGAFAIAAAIAG